MLGKANGKQHSQELGWAGQSKSLSDWSQGQECFASSAKGYGVHRGRACVTQKNKQSLNKTLQCENRLQASVPGVSKVDGLPEGSRAMLHLSGRGARLTNHHQAMSPRTVQNSHRPKVSPELSAH